VVERDLAKVDVAGSTPVSRSKSSREFLQNVPKTKANFANGRSSFISRGRGV
jgi:hypothetical protein